MSLILSLLCGFLLAAFNLAGLAWFTGKVGRTAKASALVAFAGILFVKLGISGAALFFIVHASWFHAGGLCLGLGIPVLGLMAAQAAKLMGATKHG